MLSFHSQFGDEALFDVLFYPFVHAEVATEELSLFHCQETTGALLLEIMPSCSLTLRDAISQSLPTWNLSVEQWPYYLCRQFGVDAVNEALTEIETNDKLYDMEKRAIETIRYWLRRPPVATSGSPSPE